MQNGDLTYFLKFDYIARTTTSLFVKKRHVIESEFNEKLASQEFMLKFMGDNEIVLIGAPTGRLRSRIIISVIGIALVSFCLITGNNSGGNYNNSFIIGGSLLGLILASTPFVSFYSRKYFKIYISNQLKQISITSGVSSPDKRIDFSNIDFLQLKHLQIDDLISGTDAEGISTVSYLHTFMAVSNGKSVELFTLASQDKSYKDFVDKFGDFLSGFIGKELRLIRA